MKKTLLFLFFLSSIAAYSQKEVPISYSKKAFLIAFKEPYQKINLDFEDDLNGYYSAMDVNDSIMVFRSKKEFNKYENDIERYIKAVAKDKEEEEKEKEKAKKENKPSKEIKKKELVVPDPTIFKITNRKLLKAGLDVEATYEEYRTSKLVILKRIIILTDLDAKDEYEGIYERLEGDIATIDGRAVKLMEKAQIVGKKGMGFEGKTFASFKDMMLGTIVKVSGRRHEDGVLMAEKGEVWESTEDDLDRQIKTSLKNTMKLSANDVSFSDRKFVLVQNPAIQTYVSKIGRAMIPQYQKDLDKNHPAKVDFNFYVLKDSTFNACAYPDGSVFVHSTLLEEIDNEAQLAAILGHEIAHITHKHSRKNFQTQKKVETGAKALKIGGKLFEKTVENKTGKESVIEDAAVLVATFGGPALTSKYSRDLESQADRNGLTYMVNAGYDPREAAKVWKKLSLMSDNTQPEYHFGSNLLKATSKGIETIYASHPESINRYKSLNRLLAQNIFEVGGFEDKLVGKDEYAAFKKGLKRVLVGKDFDEPVVVAQPKEESKPAVIVPAAAAPTTKATTPTTKPKAPVKKKN